MREDDLATVLVQAGLERGIEIEEIVDEVGAMPLPVFLDHHAFREALLDQVDHELRRQVDQRVERLRLRLDASSAASVRAIGAASITSSTIIEPSNADDDQQASNEPAPNEADIAASSVPSDATMIWMVEEQPEEKG